MNKRPPIFYLNIRIMIQRIQSIYLILAFVCMCFALSTPLAEFTNQTVNCKMPASHLSSVFLPAKAFFLHGGLH